jgi:hypothetical protein
MAQSMPPALLEASTGSAEKPDTSGGGGEVVEALSRTCTTLQRQVEMLQSSLTGVMSFMSAFSSFDCQQQQLLQQQQRTRHSSAASTNQDSFCYYPSGNPVFFVFMDHRRSRVIAGHVEWLGFLDRPLRPILNLTPGHQG